MRDGCGEALLFDQAHRLAERALLAVRIVEPCVCLRGTCSRRIVGWSIDTIQDATSYQRPRHDMMAASQPAAHFHRPSAVRRDDRRVRCRSCEGSVAFSYCEAAYLDKAARNALLNCPELRVFGTFLPRHPEELADWLDAALEVASHDLLVTPPLEVRHR
jgi:hypothetical protein